MIGVSPGALFKGGMHAIIIRFQNWAVTQWLVWLHFVYLTARAIYPHLSVSYCSIFPQNVCTYHVTVEFSV